MDHEVYDKENTDTLNMRGTKIVMIDQKKRSKPMTLMSLASKKQQSSLQSSQRQ